MKALTIIISIAVGIAFGMIGGIANKKPIYWKMIVILLMCIVIFLNLMPPIAGTFQDLVHFGTKSNPSMNVLFHNDPNENIFPTDMNEWLVAVYQPEIEQYSTIVISGESLPDEFKEKNTIVAAVEYIESSNNFKYIRTVSVNPWMTYPYVPGLGEKVRLINIHVPVAWVSVLAYLFAMFYAIRYLMTKDLDYDIKASSSAFLGTIFTILATVTGMVWAKSNWGSYWNWDPRETSIFLLLLIYFAYFALRSSITKQDVRARLSSVYSIIAFITVPFFIFVLPRITQGLHPGSGSEANSGPVISGQTSMLNSELLITFGLSYIGQR